MLHDLRPRGQTLPIHARAAIQRAPDAWAEWLSICAAFETGEADTAEDFGVFLAKFHQLRRLGVPFDLGFVAAVLEVERAAAELVDPDLENGDEDTDDAPAVSSGSWT